MCTIDPANTTRSGRADTLVQVRYARSSRPGQCLRLAAPVRYLPIQLHQIQLTLASYAATSPLSPAEANNEILAKQRLNRPVAPHLGIYKPQITWYGSAFNRITGVALSGGLYLFGAAYLVAPYAGWHLESSVLAASFAAWPVALKVFTKFAVAMPFMYHSLNGFRHLAWDTASMITNGQVQKTGWIVVGLSVVSSLGLALFV